jgi:hypothetical protein
VTRHAVPALVVSILLGATYLQGIYAQDAVPFAVAGQLWLDGETDAIYQWPMSDRFVAASLADAQATPEHVTPYLSPPFALPLAALMTPAAVRVSAAIALAWAASVMLRSRTSVLAWIAMIPLAAHDLAAGQNSAWIAAAVAAGVYGPPGLAGALLGLLTLTKLTPVVLVLPLIACRRWTDLAAWHVIVILSALIWWIIDAEPSLFAWSSFMDSAMPDLVKHPRNLAAPRLIRVLVGVLLGGLAVSSRLTFRERWAICWALWPFLLPLSWTYYLWAPIVGVLILTHHDEETPPCETD